MNPCHKRRCLDAAAQSSEGVPRALSQTELGNLADVSRQTISLIERGDYNPSVTLALKLAKILNASVEQLFSYTEEEQ